MNTIEYLKNAYFERVKNPLVFQNNLSMILMDPAKKMQIRECLTIEKYNGNPRLTRILKELGQINMYKHMVRRNFPELFPPEEEKEQPKVKTKGSIFKWLV